MEEHHKDILRENHTLLCSDLDLCASGILDDLEEEGVISSNEVEEITSIDLRRKQNHRFLYFLKRKDSLREPFQAFLRTLKGKYDFIADILNTDSSTVSSESKYLECSFCNLIQNLNPGILSDELYQRNAFSDDTLTEVNDEKIAQSSRAKKLLEVLKNCGQNKEINDFAWGYFLEKHKSVTDASKSLSDILSCRCKTNTCTTIQADRHSRDVNEEEENTDSGNAIIRINSDVQKCFPNDTMLFRQCSKAWETLWVLREAGKWLRYDKLFKRTLRRFSDSPDMQVMLYRHGMAKSAFYNADYSKACMLYEKALEILPKSSLVLWHKCRIFGLKSEICARKRDFDLAETYLTCAKQAAALLSPCFATGTVYFYEGIYFTHLLRSSTKMSSKVSVFNKAKEAYRLSIEHYRQEVFFEIKSLLNEVYLFLALLELQIDFKTCQPIFAVQGLKVDLSVVEYYLNLFEFECWDISTPWAKMMFFVARSEQHRHRNNMQRSIDYLSDAKSHAILGKFKDYLPRIEHNLHALQEELKQQPKLLESVSVSESESEVTSQDSEYSDKEADDSKIIVIKTEVQNDDTSSQTSESTAVKRKGRHVSHMAKKSKRL